MDEKKEEMKNKSKQDKEIKRRIIIKPFKDYKVQKCIDPYDLLAAINTNDSKDQLKRCLNDMLFIH